MTEAVESSSDQNRPNDCALVLPCAAMAETHLKHFCEGILDLLQAGLDGGSVLAPVIPTLVQAIRAGSRQTVAELRRDIHVWETACDQLQPLTRSPFFGDEAAVALSKLQRAHTQALRVVHALEALPFTSRRPAAEDAPAAHSADEAGAAGAEPIVLFPRPAGEAPRLHGQDTQAQADGSRFPVQGDASDTTPDPLAGCPDVQVEEIADFDSGGLAEFHPDVALSNQQRAADFYREAEACRRERDLIAAEDLYGKALQLNPALGVAYLRRGRLRVFQGQPDGAVEDLTKALQLNAQDFLAYWWRGDAQAVAGRHDEAVADYTRALTLRPGLFLVRYNRAVALRQRGDLERCLAELESLVQLKPTFAPIYLNRGLIYLARGNLAGAEAEFQTALRHQPDCQEASQRLQETQALLGEQPLKRPEEPAPDEAPGVSSRPALDLSAATAPVPVAAEQAAAAAPPEPSPKRPVVPAVPAPKASAGILAPPVTPAASHLPVRCPACGTACLIRWDKLQPGKVFGCPHCRQLCASAPDGQLVSIVKDKNGRWMRQEQQAREEARGRLRRYRLAAATLVLIFLSLAVAGTTNLLNSSPVEASLPVELNARAELFARAWLKGDYFLMRRMTDPDQDRKLFGWYRRNRPPSAHIPGITADDVKVAVEALPCEPSTTLLRVRFEGLYSAPRGKPVQLQLMWKERGDGWVFQPVANVKLRSAA